MQTNLRLRPSILGLTLLNLVAACAHLSEHDPASLAPHQIELNASDRSIEVWHWPPETAETNGTILFSHGAASAPWKYTELFSYWTKSGYAVYAPLHVDSTDHPNTKNYQGFASWTARLEDMTALADLHGIDEYIAAGHSYGALTALTLGGASPLRPAGYTGPMQDKDAKIVLAFSPPGAIPGFVSAADYANIVVPIFVQTGTKDILPGATDYEPHLDAYNAASANGTRIALIIDEVDHYFGGAIGRPELETTKQVDELQTAADLSLNFIADYFEGMPSQQLSTQTIDQGSYELLQK